MVNDFARCQLFAIVAAGGGALLVLGGSWYYALAGTVLAISGGLTFMGRPGGFRAYPIYFLGTAAWAVWEVGQIVVSRYKNAL